MRISLIISVYNREDFAELVLESVRRQSYPIHEVIVTEDGMRSEMAKLLKNLQVDFPYSLVHLTQKDFGNRKPLALNRAIAKASGDYLVFIDGDCLLEKDFVKAHQTYSSEKVFLTGRRVELSEEMSRTLTPSLIRQGWADHLSFELIWDFLRGRTHGLLRAIKTPHGLRKLFKRDEIDDIRGCNFSVHKKHLIAINGFSNIFSGAYGEDSDVERRLKHLGLEMKGNKGAAVQFHLWHHEQKKDAHNQVLLNEWTENPKLRCPDGLDEIGTHP